MGVFGLVLAIFLIAYSGAGEVANAMLVIGWWLVPIAAYHILPMFFSALSWRELLPRANRPGVISVTWIRWIRESINSLLPVANIGGDIASARLIHLRGVPGSQAAASMVVDTTIGVVTQLAFVMAGATLLLLRPTGHSAFEVLGGVLAAAGTLVVAVATFVVLQHRDMFARFVRLARNILPEKWVYNFAENSSAIDDAVVKAYRSGSAFWRAILFRLIGWVGGVGEVLLVTWCLGQPLGAADAFILESFSSGVRAAAFMVPAAIGVQEGGLVLFGTLFGLPAEIGLAISLSKRVRELLLGLPGLFFWYWVEAHYLLRRNGA